MISELMPESARRPRARLAFELHRSYIDLQNVDDGSLQSFVPIVAYRLLEHQGFYLQRSMTAQLRSSLKHECSGSFVAVHDPRETPVIDRSERWRNLCDRIDHFAGLNDDQRDRTSKLLTSLGFHSLVTQLLSPYRHNRRLDLTLTVAHYHIAGLRINYTPTDLTSIALDASLDTAIRRAASFYLLVHYAKIKKSVAEALAFRTLLDGLVNQHHNSANTDFETLLMFSAYYRAASFIPYMLHQSDSVRAELSLAEEYARALRPNDEWERLVARDALYFVLETRMREALWLNDYDLALERITEAVALDPLDSRAHLELGEVLLTKGRLREALVEFEAASRYGPPGSAISHYYAASCCERLGMRVDALSWFLDACEIDARSVSALNGVIRVASLLQFNDLSRWAAGCLERLKG